MNVFPFPFELKFCQFDFDYCRFERQFLISETTCLMMISFEGDVKREFEVYAFMEIINANFVG